MANDQNGIDVGKLVAQCKVQRGVAKGQITRVKRWIESSGGHANEFELQTKLELLEHYFQQFDKVQSTIEQNDDEELAGNDRETVEDHYFAIKSKLLSQLQPARSSITNVTHTA